MKFDRFTVKAKDALAAAQNHTRYLDQQQVEWEHLLIALLDQEGGVASTLLRQIGCNLESVRGQVERELSKFPVVKGGDIYLGPEVLHALSEAGYQPAYGARPLKRAIQRLVLDPLTTAILNGEVKEGQKVTVDLDPKGNVPRSDDR